MSKKITVADAKQIKAQIKTIITFATNLEAKLDTFLDGVGAVPEKPIASSKKEKINKTTELNFHKSLKIKK